MMSETIPIMKPIFELLRVTEALGEWSDDSNDVWFVALASANLLAAWLYESGYDLRLVRDEDEDGDTVWRLVQQETNHE